MSGDKANVQPIASVDAYNLFSVGVVLRVVTKDGKEQKFSQSREQSKCLAHCIRHI